jgi:DNA polymerase elongation subunit (family B)
MEPVIFQIIDWSQFHEVETNETDESDELEKELGVQPEEYSIYKIGLFGRTIDNKSIYVTLNNFTPYFYIKVPLEWNQNKVFTLINYLKTNIGNRTAVKGFKNFEIVERKDLYGFTGYKDFKFVRLIFENMKSFKAFEFWIIRNKIKYPYLYKYPVKLQIYESNIEPFIRCMHIRKLSACGWAKIDNYTILGQTKSFCDIAIETDWKNIENYDNSSIQKFIVCSYDIECMSESGNFPQATNDGDAIIQIGTVLSYYGESEPYYKNIITLKGCDKIKGLEDVDIESYKDEKSVLLAWTKLIQKHNPDVITGWNINGFDFQYMHGRAKKLNILPKFSMLSKLKGEISEFKEKTLSSSALGDNLLKFFEMNGRIVIDLMKVQQRDAKLDSYKLDFVASNYIKEKIIRYDILDNTSIIYTPSIYGIRDDNFINITWDDGLSENKHDAKYKILSLEKVSSDDNDNLFKQIMAYSKFSSYVFKKPKSMFKIIINGIIPREIFEDGNEEMWHTINNNNVTTYFYSEEKAGHGDDNSSANKNTKWIDLELEETERPIKGNKVFWAHAKDDISPKELFSLYKGSDADRGIIAKYCIMDCVLVTKLMEKLQVLNNNIGMANVCNVPLSYIFMRGQGVKIFSLVSKKCRELGFLIPKLVVKQNKSNKDDGGTDEKKFHKVRKNKNDSDSDSDDKDDGEGGVGYEGATVFPPVKGIHYEPIPVLDYASLYPRSMIYINISHECYVNNLEYDNLEGYNYETVTYNNNDGTTTTCRFAKKKDGTPGILPVILKELLDKRSATKKLMDKAEEQFLKNIYDGLQLAYKVTANSLYGQVGAPTSPIYMKELAASTTATGRKMLEFSRDFIQGVFGDLINLALHNEEKYIQVSKDLYKDVPAKKFNEPWKKRTNMDDFIKHFYDKINQILSNQYKVKPKIIYGDSVTGDTPILLLDEEGNVVIKTIQEIGNLWEEYDVFKAGEAGLSEKQQDNNIPYKVWTDKGWANIKRVIRHKTNKKIYEVLTKRGYVKVTEDHSLLDTEGNQIKPNECEIGKELLHNPNFEEQEIKDYNDKKIGYERRVMNMISFRIENGLKDALAFYYHHVSQGLNITILKEGNFLIFYIADEDDENDEIYKNQNCIVEINDLGYFDDYVYDLETEVGHFHAGVGSLIVKNTDSVFFTPKIHDIKTKEIRTDRAALRVCIEIGKLAGDTICKVLPEPEEQVYEKTLWPFVILTKKRYVGNLYEEDDSHYKQKSMGIVLKRRDNAKIVKIVVGGIVDYILNGKPGETNINDRNKGAIEYTRMLLKKILRGEYPIDKFVVSKTLRAQYADRTRIAHAYLADKIGKRDPGNKPDVNDRVPYVYIVPKSKVLLQGDRVEDPKYVITNNLEVDYLFYITNQIMKPSKQFLEHIANNPDKLFENYINKEINRRKKINSVMNYIEEEKNSDNTSEVSINIDKTEIKKPEKIDNKLESESDSEKDNKKKPKTKKNKSKKEKSDSEDDDRIINLIKSKKEKKSLTIEL